MSDEHGGKDARPHLPSTPEFLRLADRDGRPIDIVTYAHLMEDPDYRQVALTRLPSDQHPRVTISTVWLGFDHGHGLSDRPLLFETMAFDAAGVHDVQRTIRYATFDEAVAGHEIAVTQSRAELGLPRG